jgi:hypothetical protein
MACNCIGLVILRLEDQDLEDKDLSRPPLFENQVPQTQMTVIYLCASEKVLAHNSLLSISNVRCLQILVISFTYLCSEWANIQLSCRLHLACV